MTSMISTARKDIEEFLKKMEENKIYLISTTQGSGKTITSLKTFLEEKQPFVYVRDSHEALENILNDKVLKPYKNNLFHLKGRNQKGMCLNEDLDKIQKKGLNINDTLCKECNISEDCPYKQQLQKLKNQKYVLTVVQFLDVKVLQELIENEDFVIIIDENAIDLLTEENIIKPKDITTLRDIRVRIQEMVKENDFNFDNALNQFKPILEFARIFDIIFKKEKETGLKNVFNFVTKHFDEKIYPILEYQYKHGKFDVIKRLEKEYAYQLFKEHRNTSEWYDYTPIISTIVGIALTFFEYMNEEEVEASLYIRNLKLRETLHQRIHFTKSKFNLPNNTILILDATGDKDNYSKILKREVTVLKPSYQVKRSIYQIKDGRYPISGLHKAFIDGNFLIYKKIALVVDKYLKETKKVTIITYKGLAKEWYDIDKHKYGQYKKYQGFSLENYLLKYGFSKDSFDIKYFEQMRGTNDEELMKNGRIITLGTPSKDLDSFKMLASAWHIGQTPLDFERIKELKDSPYYGHDYRYKDSRIDTFIKPYREHKLEHTLERLRFILGGDKEATLFSCIPISFDTTKVTFEEYAKIKNIKVSENVYVKVLRFVGREYPIPITRDKLIGIIREWKHIKLLDTINEKGHFKALNKLLDEKYLEEVIGMNKNVKTIYYKLTNKREWGE